MTQPYLAPGDLFATTADDYIRYRPSHPTALVDALAAHLHGLPGLRNGQGQVLDLCSGPGTLALALAERGLPVVAVDASAEMLAAGQQWADERGIRNIVWRQGDAHSLSDLQTAAGQSPIAAVTIGDGFHWLNRAHVLGQLDHLVACEGFIALVGSHAPGSPRPWWEPMLGRLRERYLDDSRLAGVGTRYVEPLGGHEDVLRRSAFNAITVLRTDYRRSYSLDELIGLQKTYAYSSPAVLAEQADTFAHDITTVLRTVQPHGEFTATLHGALIIARRS